MAEGLDAARRSLVISEIRSIAGGQVFGEPEPALVAAAERLSRWSSLAGWAMVAVCAAAGLIALLAPRPRLQPRFRARPGRTEKRSVGKAGVMQCITRWSSYP